MERLPDFFSTASCISQFPKPHFAPCENNRKPNFAPKRSVFSRLSLRSTSEMALVGCRKGHRSADSFSAAPLMLSEFNMYSLEI